MGAEIKDDLKPVVKDIDGREYTFYYLRPKIAFVVLSMIVKIIGPALSSVFSGMEDNDIEKLKKGDFDVVVKEVDFDKAVKVLLDNFHVAEVQKIIDTLLDQAFCKGYERNVNYNFDRLFTGRLSHMFRVVKAALGVQYADFFGESNAVETIMGMLEANPISENSIPEI